MQYRKLKHALIGLSIAAALTTAPVAKAAVDMFMFVSGIEGESIDKQHANEIDVLAWSWGLSTRALWNMAGCGNVQDLSFTKYVDKASPKLMANVASGTLIPSARLVVRKAGEVPLEYIKIELTNVIVSSVSTGGSGGEDRLTENVTFNFATSKFTYTTPAGQTVDAMPTNVCNKR